MVAFVNKSNNPVKFRVNNNVKPKVQSIEKTAFSISRISRTKRLSKRRSHGATSPLEVDPKVTSNNTSFNIMESDIAKFTNIKSEKILPNTKNVSLVPT